MLTAPSNTMPSEHTVEKTGRLMKKSTATGLLRPPTAVWSLRVRLDHRRARSELLYARAPHPLARGEPAQELVALAGDGPDLDRPLLGHEPAGALLHGPGEGLPVAHLHGQDRDHGATPAGEDDAGAEELSVA